MKIQDVFSQELLDSRGNPTVEATIVLENGIMASALVPSGASTGTYEALELRDNDPARYLGKGTFTAVKNINEKIAPILIGMDVENQQEIDRKMIVEDGTDNKNILGANATLAVSMACSRAAALSLNLPLYKYIAKLTKRDIDGSYIMPIPMINVLNGGQHAAGSTDMQEYMIMPIGAPSIAEAVRWGSETFHVLGKILKEKGWQTTVGDEGGYAPPLSTNEEPLQLITTAIQKSGYEPGRQIAIALDPAASVFYKEGKYRLQKENRILSSEELISLYSDWTQRYPIVSIEDGLAEDDWNGWQKMTRLLGSKIQVVGDDLYVTNTKRLEKGIEMKATNSILIKLNQIGTITETLEAITTADEAGMTAVVSNRSGETEDSFIADLVVGAETGQIKTGSMSRSERMCKYNQLMRIERALGEKSQIAVFPFGKF